MGGMIPFVKQLPFFHLRNIAKVLPFINQNDAEKLIHAFISSRLDYCNAILTGLPKKKLFRAHSKLCSSAINHEERAH